MTNNTRTEPIVDHLFRHQYGKMVAILARIFGLQHLDLIEDAIQDTFLKASLQWREQQPDKPEAWLTQAAKNRVLDLLRQIQARQKREAAFPHASSALEINEQFLDPEIDDAQLRMIFVACHPALSTSEQIAFALKAISGFSGKEIASALMQKEDSIKKRLQRARKKIQEEGIALQFPEPHEMESRMQAVMQIIYLIFNEGFHSNKADSLVDKELCGEALRLCKLLLNRKTFRSGSLYALFALLCYNAARLDAKVSDDEVLDLKQQDRQKWYAPLIELGHDALYRSLYDFQDRSAYHFEALIASEHIRAANFESTNWQQILSYYQEMYHYLPSASILLSKAIIYLQIQEAHQAKAQLEAIKIKDLEQRSYLYYATWAEFHLMENNTIKAKKMLKIAIEHCTNKFEEDYLKKKLAKLKI